MSKQYNEANRKSTYLSDDPDDAGLRYRLSGDLLLVYETARARDFGCAKRTKARSSIVGFSKGSGARMGRYLRECTAKYAYMHTLTYPADYPHDGRVVKEHLRQYLQSISRLAASNGRKSEVSHFWFLEFQKRGAPHFHIFTTEFVSYEWCRDLWFNIVRSGDIRHFRACIRVEKLIKGKKGMISYARKYAMKQYQKDVPPEFMNVGRFWGIHGLKKVMSADVVFYAKSHLKSQIFEAKYAIDDLIRTMISFNSLKPIRRSQGFRMFHVEQSNPMYPVLRAAINDAALLQDQDRDMFIDAELSDRKQHLVDRESGHTLSKADSYNYNKWGHVEVGIYA